MSHVDEGTLHALVDDALDAAERAAVEAHLAVCGECARQFAEATAMARQVSTLLQALDAPAPAVRVVSPAPVAVPTPVTPLRPRGIRLRRVAMAASLLVVAGVSYRVGTNRPAAEVAVMDSAVSRRMTPAPMRAVPSVVEAAPEAFAAAPVPSVRQRPSGGPRSESDGTAVAASPSAGAADAPAAPRALVVTAPAPVPAVAMVTPSQTAGRVSVQSGSARVADEVAERTVGAAQEQRGQAGAAPTPSQAALASAAQNASQPAPQAESRRRMERPLEQLSQVVVTGVTASNEKSTAPKATPLAGYVVSEDASTPAVTRRSYVSASGTSVVLSIVQPAGAQQKAARAPATASEFIVSTASGQSTVRWSVGGTEYTLQGALAPDSLVKLATLLKP